MIKFNFDGPSVDNADAGLSAECQGQLLHFIDEIVRQATASGWKEDDVLLALVEVAWDRYEKRRGDL